MCMPKPRAEHAFLNRLVGRWRVSGEEIPGNADWIEEVRSLNGIWFVAECRGSMPDGSDVTAMLTLGHNGETGRYVGSWIGTMMEHMWVYDGELSADEGTLCLYTTGPSCTDAPGMQACREEMSFSDDDHRRFVSSMKQPDGSWKQFMRADYLRIT
ncbi:DUF1579 domain-containing protein [Rhizobium sp. SAFR-030]|uniref:DUF1579 domain-containing protein n=1 Tax=Rhizobium sp. SAFR-030 TaxID=3387277 RepID=UPI003F821D84